MRPVSLSISLPALALAISLCLSIQLTAQDWPQFRGQTGDSLSTAKLPVTWKEADFKWNTKLPGKGWSSPVYVDGKAWMTTAIVTKATKEQIQKKLDGVKFARVKTADAAVEFRALCVDLESGEVLHNIELGRTDNPQTSNPMNSYASPTPAIADGKVVCHFGAYGTWCLDANTGKELWETEYIIQHSVGPGSSPIIADGKVVLVCDGTEQQFVAAVNLSDGKEAWKTARPPIAAKNGEFRKSYCTPIVRDVDGQQQVIVTGADWICGYAVSSGEEIWRLKYGRGYSITGMPALVGDLVVFVTGYDNNEIVAFDPSGSGELDQSAIKWRTRGAPTMASIVVGDGLIFSANDRGVLSAIDPADGSTITKVRTIGNCSSSPLLANGNLYLANRDGAMVVVSADKELKQLHEFDFGAGVYACPSPIGNDLLIRTTDSIVRISNEK